MNYYIFENNNFNRDKTLASLKEYCDAENIIILPEKPYILRVPFAQKYKGNALILSSTIVLNNCPNFEIIDLGDSLGFTNKEETIFLINCEHPLIKEKLSVKNMMSMSMVNRSMSILEFKTYDFGDILENNIIKEQVYLGQHRNSDENIIN